MRSRLIALEKEPPLTISTNISSMGRVLGILICDACGRAWRQDRCPDARRVLQEDPIEGRTRKAKIIEKHPRLKLTRVLQGRCHLVLREHTQLGIQSPDVHVEIRKLQIPQPAWSASCVRTKNNMPKTEWKILLDGISKSCRSRKKLKNAPPLAIVAVHTAENEPPIGLKPSMLKRPRWWYWSPCLSYKPLTTSRW